MTIYPTDTVWGLGAPVHSREENDKVRLAKKNSLDKPLSVIFYGPEHLKEFLRLPLEWSDDERLKGFFEREGTLAVPRDCLKSDWGEWIYRDSAFATVRCLPLTFLQQEGVPFSTTSLNYQGEAPITDLAGALAFSDKLNIDHRLIADKSFCPSGMASTIFALLPGGKTECWREGRFFQEIVDIFG